MVQCGPGVDIVARRKAQASYQPTRHPGCSPRLSVWLSAPADTPPDGLACDRTYAAVTRGNTLAEEVGFEPTDPCRSHAFQACRFGRSRTPPVAVAETTGRIGRIASHTPAHIELVEGTKRHLCWQVAVGSCATPAREPSQGRKAAALSGIRGVPQITWPLPPRTGAVWRPQSGTCLRRQLPADEGPAVQPASGWNENRFWVAYENPSTLVTSPTPMWVNDGSIMLQK